jgi:tripartite-type tricarboxylate transporter receptor subunit TctC
MLFTHANRARAVHARAAKAMLIGLLASLSWLSSMAQAQGNAAAWPNKPIRLINPLGTGGTAEVLARHAAKMLSDGLGQPIIVETKSGAAGTIGADYVAKAAPDGYTLLYGVTGANVIAPAIYRKLPYDPVKDLAPISMLFSGTNYLLVHPSLGVKSLAEFIALAKSRPGSITFASAGSGSMSHLNAETLKTITGIDLVHVPYKGGGAAAPDLISGQVQMMIETGASAVSFIRSGRLQALAVTTAKRSPSAPDVPSFSELGYPGMTTVVWGGLFAPGATPRPILDRVAAEVAKAMNNSAYREALAQLSNEPAAMNPDEFRSFTLAEMARYADAVKRSGMKLD